MRNIVIVDGVRTPFGRLGGGLRQYHPGQLAAFAIKALMERMGGQSINMDGWNPNGGAIAFGHPNGASGTRIALSAIRHLENTQGQFALVSSCCGGDIGASALFENM